MSIRNLILLVFLLGTASATPYNCTKSYDPSVYVGESKVPSNCTVEQLNCPSSWKSGIPKGSETSAPMIYHNFLSCHEGFTLCGYVPVNPKSGEVLGHSGVTIGAGVDLGSKSGASFPTVSSIIVDKLEPYFGLKRNLAACAAIEHPLRLATAEVNTLTDVITNDVVDKVSKRYNNDKDENALNFTSVPRGIRTAIVSVWFQFGYPQAYPKFWNFVNKNDWDNAIKELRYFYTNPDKQANGNLKRRNNEADIIEATLAKCSRSVDVVFLIDESGSVGSTHFLQSLDFVKNMIKAFPDDKLSGENGTRFGLSTFSSSYRQHFYLSSYTRQSDYLSAIGQVSYSGGGTSLGRALGLILNDQFSEERGLRPEVDGVPRILMVLTDGISGDSVSIPAKNVRDENIVIYAIGIASYNFAQLQEIASSESHIYTLSTFSELDKFISTLTSSTCYEPRPVSLNDTVITNVAKDTYEYFTYEINESANLEINVIDLSGSTIVYASRTNPHPYKYDYDFAFDLSTQKNKVIVISGRIPTKVKRSTDDELTQRIYVSVTSNTESASFKIEANECDPSNCTEGTNEMSTTPPPTTQVTTNQPNTTQSPTTSTPTTAAPTTAAPTTAAPTTAAPTTTPSSSDTGTIATRLMVVSIAMLMMVF